MSTSDHSLRSETLCLPSPLEFDPEAVNLLIAADGEEVLEEQVKMTLFKTRSHSCYDYREMNAKLFAFLDSLTK